MKKKLDVKKLSEPQVQDALKNALASNLPADPQAHDDLETAWPSFRHATLLSLCLVTPERSIRTGSARATRRFSVSWQRREQLTQPGSVIRIDKDCAAKHDRFKKVRSEAQSKTRQTTGN